MGGGKFVKEDAMPGLEESLFLPVVVILVWDLVLCEVL